MTKKVISIVSVLKPIDDTRNYEKIATSIGNTNKYDINIIGFSTKNNPDHPNIDFYPVFNFKRTSLKRLLAPLKIIRLLLKLKPELIIATCPEILIVITVYKILFGAKMLYDVQENYYRNIMYSAAYSGFIKYPALLLVMLNEIVCKPFIDGFILAESIYHEQLNFPKQKTIIIENKAYIPDSLRKRPGTGSDVIKFVYTGTIAQHYGIFDAIHFVDRLIENGIKAYFMILGHAAKNSIYKMLCEKIQDKIYIKLVGGNTLVPHHQILEELCNSDFCLLPYQENKSTAGRIPTRLFECLALEIPMIIQPNPTLDPYIIKNKAGIMYDFQSSKLPNMRELQQSFYGNNTKEQYKWDSNIIKLTSFVNRIID